MTDLSEAENENENETSFGDFDIDSEYIPDPLIPNGRYYGSVRGVKADPKACCIVWEVVLSNNDLFASDGETPVDGMVVWYRNWLPKPGDENEFSKNGKTTKRQSKINMLGKFAKSMRLNMNSPKVISQAIQNGEWIGLDVVVDVTISEYKGDVKNEVSFMIAN